MDMNGGEGSNSPGKLAVEDNGQNDGELFAIEESLLHYNMPGVMNMAELTEQIDLDLIKIKIGRQIAKAGDLLHWETYDIDDMKTIKGIIAELVAVVGPKVAERLIVQF